MDSTREENLLILPFINQVVLWECDKEGYIIDLRQTKEIIHLHICLQEYPFHFRLVLKISNGYVFVLTMTMHLQYPYCKHMWIQDHG